MLNNLDEVIKMTDEDIKKYIDQKDEKGKTALIWAVSNNNIELANFLLDKNADITSTDDDESTVLHYAVVLTEENVDFIHKLLSHKKIYLIINKKDKKNNSPLMYSLMRGNQATAKLLLVNGAQAGQTELSIAKEKKYSEIHKIISSLFDRESQRLNSLLTTLSL